MAIEDSSHLIPPALAAMVDVSDTQQQQNSATTTNPNMTLQNQQHNPQSPPILEADPEHIPNSDPDDGIEADPNQDDDVDVDVEMVNLDADHKPDSTQEEEGEEEENFEKVVGEVGNNFIKFDENGTEEGNVRFSFDGINVGGKEQILRRCTLALGGVNFESMDFEEEEQGQEVEGEEEEEEGEEEAEQEEEYALPMAMGGETSNNLFRGMEGMQNSIFRAGSSQFGHANGNKRMRSGASDFDICMEQFQHTIEKARMIYNEKDQACAESNMNQQFLLNELHKREAENQQLQATIQCLQHKRQSEVYRYERELYLMTDLLNGYRQALKETRKAFAEYRESAPCPQLDVPLYKDVNGGGGLVVSVVELEKRRLKEEEEKRINRLLTEKMLKDFEAESVAKLQAYIHVVESMNNRLLGVENQIETFRESIAKRKASKS